MADEQRPWVQIGPNKAFLPSDFGTLSIQLDSLGQVARSVNSNLYLAGNVDAIDLTSTLITGFDTEAYKLKQRVQSLFEELKEERSNTRQKDEKVEELNESLKELEIKLNLQFLLGRVNTAAQVKLRESNEFQQQFLSQGQCATVVMSVDIRRSTELMLKARKPEDFADFITQLCQDLMRVVTTNFGVFDKFTGDGVLAFFPEFYSGDDAIYHAISAADECHKCFEKLYGNSRRSFTSVLADVGLGIGIDYGEVRLMKVADGLTVVGTPVVYACRLSGAPPFTTLVNQPAYELVCDKIGSSCHTNETRLEIKHEGVMIAYKVQLNGRRFRPASPKWLIADEEHENRKKTK